MYRPAVFLALLTTVEHFFTSAASLNVFGRLATVEAICRYVLLFSDCILIYSTFKFNTTFVVTYREMRVVTKALTITCINAIFISFFVPNEYGSIRPEIDNLKVF
jgi:hypothetical protein